ncbi:MAG TPA: glycosyltransferase family 4 protein [Pyrinomonadaceae bacterium]
MKVLLIGSYPPPLGGVSVFVKRYKRQLEDAGHTVDTLDPTRLAKTRLYRELLRAPAKQYDLISLNFPSLYIMAALLVLGLSKRTEVFDHNWRLLEKWNALERRFYIIFLNNCRELVLVAPHLQTYYHEQRIPLPHARTRIQHAFIPPPAEDEAPILESYSVDVREFLARSRPLLVANSFRITFHNGTDLYGLDMCVELVARLKQTHPRVGLLFALAEIGDPDYYERIRQKIVAHGIVQNFHFLTGQKEIWPLFKRADAMLRPTFTDGYALSVAEAIHFGCPVLASDAAERPPQATLFANRNQQDFQQKCLALLSTSTRRENNSQDETTGNGDTGKRGNG